MQGDPEDQRGEQGDGDRREVDEQRNASVGGLQRRRRADHQGDGPRPRGTRQGQRNEGQVAEVRGDLFLVRQQVVLDFGLVRRGGGEQHGEADIGDDQPAGDAQAGNGDAEHLHHQAAAVEADQHDQRHVEAGLEYLPVALRRRQAAAEAEQQ